MSDEEDDRTFAQKFNDAREEAYANDPNKDSKDKTQSLLNTEVKFTTQSLMKLFIISFFIKNGRVAGIVLMVLFCGLGLFLLFKAVFFQVSAQDFIAVWDLAAIPFSLFFSVLQNVLFKIPEFAYPIWFYIISHIFFTWLFGRTKDVFGFMYLKGDRKLKIVLWPRYFDTAGHQYIGGRAAWTYRLFHGNPRYPLHQEFYEGAIHQTARLEIIEVANGRNLQRQWTGTILIIQTDPTDDIDDDEEVSKILLIHDEEVMETGDYRRSIKIDETHLVAFADFQSMIIGEQLQYKEKYYRVKDDLAIAGKYIDDLQMDQTTRLARDLTQSAATRARRNRGEANPAEDGLDELDEALERSAEQLGNL